MLTDESPIQPAKECHATILSLSLSLSLSHEAASVVLRINTGNGMESKASFVDGLLLRAPLGLLISLPGPFAVWNVFLFSAPIFFFILFWAKGKSLNCEEAVRSVAQRLHVRCSLSFNPQRLPSTAHCSRHSSSQNTQGRYLSNSFFFFWVQVVFLFHRLRPYYFIIFLIDVDIYLFHAVVLKICRLLCVCSE